MAIENPLFDSEEKYPDQPPTGYDNKLRSGYQPDERMATDHRRAMQRIRDIAQGKTQPIGDEKFGNRIPPEVDGNRW